MSEQPAAAAAPDWDVADRMRKALRHAGVGVAEMADYLGVSRTSISNWINGRVEPSVQTMRLWAMRCGVTYEWLAGDGTRRPRRSYTPGRERTCSVSGPPARHLGLAA